MTGQAHSNNLETRTKNRKANNDMSSVLKIAAGHWIYSRSKVPLVRPSHIWSYIRP